MMSVDKTSTSKTKQAGKTGQRAIVTGNPWVYRERIIDGYFTVATFKGGKQI